MKQKFIEWFIKNNNGCSPAMEDDRSFVHEKTQHMFEAYQAGVAEGEAKCAALAAENAGLKSVVSEINNELYGQGFQVSGWHLNGALEPLDNWFTDNGWGEPETPATDAFLAEVRAQSVDVAIATAKNVVAQEFQYKDFETAQRVCSKFPESDLVGKVEMVEWLEDFAAQIRKGVQS